MNHNINEKALKPVKQKLQRRLLAIRNVRFARRMWEASRDQVTVLKDLTDRTPIVSCCRPFETY